ncbi:type 1 ribosome-inactivating protein musarmin 1 [Tanacetum coccineum]
MRKVERSFPNDGEFTSKNLCNIILKFGGRKLTLMMTTYDFYLHGYKDNNGTLWEMRKSRDVARLKGSTPIGVGLNYPSLIGLQINKEGLVTAFNHLAQMGSNVEITNNFARLCLVLSEASRFEPIGTQFGHALCRNDNIVVDQWIHDLVKNWALLSSIVALCDEENIILTDQETTFGENARDLGWIQEESGQKYNFSTLLWRRSQNLHLMPSVFYSDGVTTFYDDVTLADKEKPLEYSTADGVRKP